MDKVKLAAELLALFRDSLQAVYARFTADDRANLERYALRIAETAADARNAATPEDRVRHEGNLRSYENAISAMVARYEILFAGELEKTMLRALLIAGRGAVHLLVAAL